jgi:hypothetical protein
MSGNRKTARPTRPQATRPPPNMPVLRGSCRVHGTRYDGCPLDMIEIEQRVGSSSFWQVVGWIIALLFLAAVFS